MANITFYLKTGKTNKNGERSIILRICFHQKRSIIFINKMVQPKHWNAKKQSVRPPTQRESDNDYENINRTIKTYKEKAELAIDHALRKKIPFTDSYFKNYFGNKYVKPQEKGFFEWFDEYISSSKSNRAERTITGYTTVSNFL